MQPKPRPKPEDVFPGDPKWERIGERVIRRYKGTNKPEGVRMARSLARYFSQRNKLIKEAKEFREQHEIPNPTAEAPLEGIRPTDASTGEGAWPRAPAAQSAAPAHAQKEITRHIVEFCTSRILRLAIRDISGTDALFCDVLLKMMLLPTLVLSVHLTVLVNLDVYFGPLCLALGGPHGSTSAVTHLGGWRNSTHILGIGTRFGQPSRPLPENVSNTMVILPSSGLRDVIAGDIM